MLNLVLLETATCGITEVLREGKPLFGGQSLGGWMDGWMDGWMNE
jgi:hypothetical protein